MKNIIPVLMALLIITSVQAQKKETRNVDTFSQISYRVPGKLYLRQGSQQKVEIEGDEEVLGKIKTTVGGNKLTIETESSWRNWSSNDKVNIYITMKNIESLHVAGSGNLIAESKITANDLDLKVSGSGSMQLEAEADGRINMDVSGSGRIDFKGKGKSLDSDVSGSGKVALKATINDQSDFGISGSGEIEASGSANRVRATISGSGKVLAAGFESNRCEVRISGSGDVEINVKDEIDANISGSGSVGYRGNPNKVNSHSSGSGKVRKLG